MTDERWQRVNELFQAALDRDAAERQAFLDRACAGDEALLGEVKSLLSSHQRAGDFLDAPAPQLALSGATTEDAEPRGEQLAFGHYHHAQYDAACIHALLGRPDDAMAWLADAARNGYPCVTFFENDDFLASLRGDERFLLLMRELREEREGYARLYSSLREVRA